MSKVKNKGQADLFAKKSLTESLLSKTADPSIPQDPLAPPSDSPPPLFDPTGPQPGILVHEIAIILLPFLREADRGRARTEASRIAERIVCLFDKRLHDWSQGVGTRHVIGRKGIEDLLPRCCPGCDVILTVYNAEMLFACKSCLDLFRTPGREG